MPGGQGYGRTQWCVVYTTCLCREEKSNRFRKEQEDRDVARQAARKVKTDAEEAAARQAEAQRW